MDAMTVELFSQLPRSDRPGELNRGRIVERDFTYRSLFFSTVFSTSSAVSFLLFYTVSEIRPFLSRRVDKFQCSLRIALTHPQIHLGYPLDIDGRDNALLLEGCASTPDRHSQAIKPDRLAFAVLECRRQ
jgi:hypothetical protein